MDASDKGSGAVLSFGKTWESAHPIAFESRMFKGVQLHYPVHEKEMLAIIRALDKWHADLLGVPFLVYTDHKTLENFDVQQDLSQRQARWIEFMSQFDAKIIYLKGEDNIVADSLSRLPSDTPTMAKAEGTYIFGPDDDESREICSIYCPSPLTWDLAKTFTELDLPSPDNQSVNICSTMSISADKTFPDEIKAGYQEDNWVTKTLVEARPSLPGIKLVNSLWYVGDCLIIPCIGNVCETLFRLAHDVLGHFSFNKTCASLHKSYHWPNMRKELETSYVPRCMDCQRNKSATSKPCGLLHPLPKEIQNLWGKDSR